MRNTQKSANFCQTIKRKFANENWTKVHAFSFNLIVQTSQKQSQNTPIFEFFGNNGPILIEGYFKSVIKTALKSQKNQIQTKK
jgi:hypothetical protein